MRQSNFFKAILQVQKSWRFKKEMLLKTVSYGNCIAFKCFKTEVFDKKRFFKSNNRLYLFWEIVNMRQIPAFWSFASSLFGSSAKLATLSLRYDLGNMGGGHSLGGGLIWKNRCGMSEKVENDMVDKNTTNPYDRL